MEKKTIIVVGAGAGLGNAVAKEFAGHDFRVVLIARNHEHLDAYKKEFDAEGIETYVQVADAAKPETLTAAIEKVRAELGTPDALVYNIGSTVPDGDRKITSSLLMERYQVDVASGYHCAELVATDEFPECGTDAWNSTFHRSRAFFSDERLRLQADRLSRFHAGAGSVFPFHLCDERRSRHRPDPGDPSELCDDEEELFPLHSASLKFLRA